ncbi:ABC transporter permease [Oleiphilus sp. HI0071]|nr:ABC transporter permease [Oleiphilus sp. HI0065]KZY79293.1 ABC transporter permease [Oleiphilus sp. HI0071]KZY92658.1 ABC transporter permease [Oleiphilus sp. HI0073]KZZ16823.1 ABC transporter permease [Oleiphilus sp. HI0079]KZZ17288.1 ABC transporter permease [Oleiphilus sp. HI0080]KZZ50552.1 ABC transporter permease [Oleiphilus sp. HI0118]KZZ61037.1 ABC transporter permease [Oleiphilus sp. HI0122]KZZ77122.1 ABC transporter permease [Oleiphilus sp. HI0130]KZZ82499.1 ABC transporter perm
MSAKDWSILIGLSILWGGSFFFNEITLTGFSPLTVVWLRVTIAAACLWFLVFAKNITIPKTGTFWWSIILMGLINNAMPFSLIVWGQQEIGSGLASILNATTPLFTVLVAGALLSDERIAPLKILGVLIGLGGVAAMIGPQYLSGLGESVSAQLSILGAALCYAFAGVFGRRFREMQVSPVMTATLQVSMASLWLLPVCIFGGHVQELSTANSSAWLAVAALGTFCTALAYIGYFSLLSSSGATNLSLVTFLVPISAILLGWLFLGEQLKPIHYFGMACIFTGLAAIDGRPFKKLRQRKEKVL